MTTPQATNPLLDMAIGFQATALVQPELLDATRSLIAHAYHQAAEQVGDCGDFMRITLCVLAVASAMTGQTTVFAPADLLIAAAAGDAALL